MTNSGGSYYDDRRAHKRYRLDAAVSVCYAGDFSIQKCVQISEGGMLLSAQADVWSVGSQIEICFLIPGGKSVILNGEIVYDLKLQQGQTYAGVRFINLSSSVQELLGQYVSTLDPI